MSKTPVIVIPLANDDFDPSEVVIPWQLCKAQGFEVKFATCGGKQANADPLMLSGEGLDPWGFIPILRKIPLLGLTLRAKAPVRKGYEALLQDSNYQNPLCYKDLKVEDYDGIFLPGGHAPKMRQYLEDKDLQCFVADYFEPPDGSAHKPVGAVCHGVLVLARAQSKTTGKSVLYGKKTTALTWKLEKTAWMLTKYYGRFWDSNYYRTYQESDNDPYGYWGVEQEIKRALKSEDDFKNVDPNVKGAWLKESGLDRDTIDNDKPAWIVQDGNYVSGRWPGDVYTLSKRFIELVKQAQ